MQFLWVWIDEIMGKGLSLFELIELVFYLSMTMVPMAMVVAVLISSVMVMGGLAEHYELSSFKSAGVSLFRVLRPMAVVGGCIAVVSFFVSDRVIPWANLQFYSRLYDIRKAKPTLSLEAGVFNDEFQEYTLRIGKKGADGKSLEDVMVYGNKNEKAELVNQTLAKKGEMFPTEDKQYIIMNLFDGTQYQETGRGQNGKTVYPFVRIHFKSWQKIFDLTQFEKSETDTKLFASNYKMFGTQRLRDTIKRIDRSIVERKLELKGSLSNIFVAYAQQSAIPQKAPTNPSTPTTSKSPPAHGTPKYKVDLSVVDNEQRPIINNQEPINNQPQWSKPTKQLIPNFLSLGDSLKTNEMNILTDRAEMQAKSMRNSIQNAQASAVIFDKSRRKYEYEMHLKYTTALACFVFIFVGGPMGAIVRKGGFGIPILIAIIFFMIYIVMGTYCKNMNEAMTLSASMSAWLPPIIMALTGIILTFRAMNDYVIINFAPKTKIIAIYDKIIKRAR
jgi:lipopolysaccharide export system permease protein